MLTHQKCYLSAARALVTAEKTLYSSDLVEIGALEGIKDKLTTMKNVLSSHKRI
jgi:hypothetical protein